MMYYTRRKSGKETLWSQTLRNWSRWTHQKSMVAQKMVKNLYSRSQMEQSNFFGGDQVLRTSTLIRDNPDRGEEQGNLQGESDGSSSTPLRDSSWYDGEARNDFCSPGGWGPPRPARNRRRRTREGPEPACAQTHFHFGVAHGGGEGRINVLPWYRQVGVAKYLQLDALTWGGRENWAAREDKWSPRGTGMTVLTHPCPTARKFSGRAARSPWTRPSAPGCGDTLKA